MALPNIYVNMANVFLIKNIYIRGIKKINALYDSAEKSSTQRKMLLNHMNL